MAQKADENSEELEIDLADELCISITSYDKSYDIEKSWYNSYVPCYLIVTLKDQQNKEWVLNSLTSLCAFHLYQSKSLNNYQHVSSN